MLDYTVLRTVQVFYMLAVIFFSPATRHDGAWGGEEV
jgi:hypothetical protein